MKRPQTLLAQTTLCLLISSLSWAEVTPYNFGSHIGSPKSLATNPALSLFCKNNFHFGFATRSTNITIERDSGNISPKQPGGGYGDAEFGGCFSQVDWITTGGYIRLSTFTFDFSTQSIEAPAAFPYDRNNPPLGAFGGGVRLTDSLYAGLAWRVIATADVDINQILSTQEVATSATVNVRPHYNYILGGAYTLNSDIFHIAYTPEEKGNVDLDLNVDLNLDIFNLDIDFAPLYVNGAIAYTPATLTMGYWTKRNDWSLDVGIEVNQWSKMGRVFLDIELPLNIDDLLFTDEEFELRDTYNPYAVVTIPKLFVDEFPGTLSFGYSFRPSAVKERNEEMPLNGADIHLFKASAGIELNFQNYPVFVEGEIAYGRLKGSGNRFGSVTGDTFSMGINTSVLF